MILSMQCIIDEVEKHINECEDKLKTFHPDCMTARVLKRKRDNLGTARLHLLRCI